MLQRLERVLPRNRSDNSLEPSLKSFGVAFSRFTWVCTGYLNGVSQERGFDSCLLCPSFILICFSPLSFFCLFIGRLDSVSQARG